MAILSNFPAGGGARLQRKEVKLPQGAENEPYAVTPDSGYDGLSRVEIDASYICQHKYNDGYADGQASGRAVTTEWDESTLTLTITEEGESNEDG